MVDTAKIEAEAKELAAETTSVLSGMFGALNPRWPRFVETWRGWSLRKKSIAVMVLVLACGFFSAFGVGTLRLMAGSYRSAYAYGHGDYVSLSDANRMLTEHDSVLRSEIKTLSQHADTLDAGLHQLDSRLKAVEAKPEPAKITTGSIEMKKPHPKKAARKPASSSSWLSFP